MQVKESPTWLPEQSIQEGTIKGTLESIVLHPLAMVSPAPTAKQHYPGLLTPGVL